MGVFVCASLEIITVAGLRDDAEAEFRWSSAKTPRRLLAGASFFAKIAKGGSAVLADDENKVSGPEAERRGAMPESHSHVRWPWADMDAGYAAAMARAEALVLALREPVQQSEALRRLPAETERYFHEAGLFRILQPRRVDGAELDYVAYMSGAAQRQFRDAHAIAAHISFSFDAAGSQYGRIAFGLPNENPIL